MSHVCLVKPYLPAESHINILSPLNYTSVLLNLGALLLAFTGMW